MEYKRLLFYLILTLFSSSSNYIVFGQEPAYYVIGLPELSNTDIYSIKSLPNGNLYIGTNDGLYSYQHGEFQKVGWNCNHNGNSLFCLRVDNQGELYAINLSGQIFKVENDRLEFYVQVPNEYLNTVGVDFTFDQNDNLIFRSKVFAIYKKQQWSVLLDGTLGGVNFNPYDPSDILIPSANEPNLYRLSNEKLSLFTSSKVSNALNYNVERNFPFKINNQYFTINNSGEIYSFQNESQSYIEKRKYSGFKQVSETEIWTFFKSGGAGILQFEKGIPQLTKVFDNFLISAIEKTEDGTYFLGTFGKGLLVIPDMKVKSYQTDLPHIKHFDILKGKLLSELPGNVKAIDISPNEQLIFDVDGLFVMDKINFNFYDSNPSLLYQFQSQSDKSVFENGLIGAIKNCVKVDSSTVLVTSSFGLFKIGPGLEHLNWIKNGDKNYWHKLGKEKERSNAVGYNKITHELVYTVNGALYSINLDNRKSEVLYEQQSINVTDIAAYKDFFFCSTSNDGILVVKKGTVLYQIGKEEGLVSETVKKLLIKDQLLFISSKKGFQILNLEDRSWSNLGKYDRVLNGLVNDFMIDNNILWLASGSKIISIPLDYNIHAPKFKLEIDSIRLGSNTFLNGNNFETTYDQANFQISLKFKGIHFEKEAKVEYRLNNSEWTVTSSNTSTINYSLLAPGDYNFQIRVNYLNNYSDFHEYHFVVKGPFWQRWWFYIIVFFFVLIVFIGIMRLRVKRIHHKQELITNSLESELKALRSQMNPHFIFNSLNSIQDLVIQQDTKKTYDYIVNFSQLMRDTLRFSNLNFISIQEELDFLDVYLSLEKLRFEDSLDYEINYEGLQNVLIPSMLIQPFIENALVHGLLHKKGEKRIKIDFVISDSLQCIITDNGIGRKRAKEILQRQKSSHKSFATEAITQRLNLLNEQLGEKASYMITDLIEMDKCVGTKVIITLPLKFKND